MRERRILFRNLVHDILEDNPETAGIETGCGIVLLAKPELITDDATSCLGCISGEFEFQRALSAMELLKKSPDMLPEYQEMLRKKLTMS